MINVSENKPARSDSPPSKPAPCAADGGFRAQETLLELGRIAGLPFGARWLFMANGHRWSPFSSRPPGGRRRTGAAGDRRRHVTMVL